MSEPDNLSEVVDLLFPSADDFQRLAIIESVRDAQVAIDARVAIDAASDPAEIDEAYRRLGAIVLEIWGSRGRSDA